MSTRLPNLHNIFESEGREYSLGLFDKFLVLREKLNGTSISFIVKDNKPVFYKTGSPKPLSFLDRTLQSIYESTIQYITETFQQHNNPFSSFLEEGFQFDLKYFPEETKYRPTNGLVLESVRDLELNKFIEEPSILNYYAHQLDIDSPPIIKYGRLSKIQKTNLNEWIDKPENIYKDMKNMFGQNPLSNGYTYKFLDKLEETISAKVLNPKTDIKVSKESRTHSDTYAIALQDIIAFLNTVNFDTFKAKGDDKEQRRLNLISDIYAKYIAKNGSKYTGMEDLDGPDFSKDIPEFNVNLKFVVNKNTKNYLQKSEINRELFKLFLGTFSKKRKKTSVLVDEHMKNEINKIVDTINDRSVDEPQNRESIPTFEDYYYDKYQKRALFEAELFEGIVGDLIHKEPGKQPVNILVGRFQPPTLGHIKVLRQLHAQNSLPCVVVQVISKSGKNQQFDEATITKIWMDIAKQYKFIAGIKESTNGFLAPVLNALRPEFEPVLWGTGTDRYKDYERMIKKYGEEANVLPDFHPYEIKRNDKNISATKVREALTADDESEFKKLTPKAEHKFYKQLRNELQQS